MSWIPRLPSYCSLPAPAPPATAPPAPAPPAAAPPAPAPPAPAPPAPASAPLESNDSDDSASIMQDDLGSDTDDSALDVDNGSKAPTAPRPSVPPKIPGLQKRLGFGGDKEAWLDFRVLSFLQTFV